MFVARRLLDTITPRSCCVCGKRLSPDEQVVCAGCLVHLPLTGFLHHPYDNEMAKAFWGKIRHFRKAFAPIYHLPHTPSARIVYQLKYFDKPDIGIDVGMAMGTIMAGEGFFDGIDCLLPVPLAKKRQRERGYNQSLMIAEGLRMAYRLPIVANAVRRVSFEASQTKKGRVSRSENVEHAFELANDRKIKGRHVLVVDDVVTTGATVCALATQLERAEVAAISVAAIGYAGEWREGKKP